MPNFGANLRVEPALNHMLTHSDYLSIIEQALKDLRLPERPAGLYEPIRYALECGGKRLRPVLTLAACDAFGPDAEEALSQAIAVEMFHNFTLLHDDVMDHADMRRGRPTVHTRWDDRTAILSGDAMLSMAYDLVVSDCPGPVVAQRAMTLFHRTAMEVYEGQQYDMDFESRADVGVEEYMEMIRLKTSVLLGCACEMGAIVGGASDESCRAMYGFGEQLGLAFQLQDDYLDTYGDPIVFGKEIGGDILNEKKTWLLITAMAEAPEAVELALTAGSEGPGAKIEAVRGVYDRLDLPRRCHELIDGYVESAIRCLDRAALTPAARDFFAGIADRSRTRQH